LRPDRQVEGGSGAEAVGAARRTPTLQSHEQVQCSRAMSRVLGWVIRWSGLAWIVRNTRARRRVSVVLYHDPPAQRFAEQLEFLAARYSLIPLERLAAALESGDWDSLPPRPLVITIDDGHAGNAGLLE